MLAAEGGGGGGGGGGAEGARGGSGRGRGRAGRGSGGGGGGGTRGGGGLPLGSSSRSATSVVSSIRANSWHFSASCRRSIQVDRVCDGAASPRPAIRTHADCSRKPRGPIKAPRGSVGTCSCARKPCRNRFATSRGRRNCDDLATRTAPGRRSPRSPPPRAGGRLGGGGARAGRGGPGRPGGGGGGGTPEVKDISTIDTSGRGGRTPGGGPRGGGAPSGAGGRERAEGGGGGNGAVGGRAGAGRGRKGKGPLCPAAPCPTGFSALGRHTAYGAVRWVNRIV